MSKALCNSSNTQAHLKYLDGFRALAAIFVVIHHAVLQVDFDFKSMTGFIREFVHFFSFGHYAVDLFIVLSGFCLMLPFVRRKSSSKIKISTFLIKRVRRILPTYYLAMVLSLFLIKFLINQKTGTHWDDSATLTAKGIIAHLFLIQDIFHDTSKQINYAFWSISVEWRIYLCFPILLMAWRRIGAIFTTILTMSFSYLLLILLDHTSLNNTPIGISPQYLGLFTLGMLGADISFSDSFYYLKSSQGRLWQFLSITTVLLVVLVSSEKLWAGHLLPLQVRSFFVGICAMSLLITISHNNAIWLTKFLSWRPLVFIGTFAYSIYLMHAPLLQILWQYALYPLHLNSLATLSLLCFIGIPIILGISYLFFLMCERPFLSQRKL